MRIMAKDVEPFLFLAGILSALAALLHVAVIVGGPAWYRFFGAGDEMVAMAESGSPIPSIVTFCITLVLASWAFYAFSGAGLVRRLPLLRAVLVGISVIYLVRGLGIIPFYLINPEVVDSFLVWSSMIVTGYGLVHLAGIIRRWNELGERRKIGERRVHER